MHAALSAEALEVEMYRIGQFERLGFSLKDALVAIDQGIDWHDVDRLVSRGCSHDLALTILSP